MSFQTLIWLIPVPPLLAFIGISLFTSRYKALSHGIAISAAALSWLGSMVVVSRAIATEGINLHPLQSQINWMTIGEKSFLMGVRVDAFTALALFFVSWTVLMIFIYSTGYHNFGSPSRTQDQPGIPPKGMEITSKGDKHLVPTVEPLYGRFFGFVSLFAFAMYLLVVSDNLLTLFVGWEIMGLCSYLLIGFWYAKPSARDAAIKAFITTRVGDVFMLLGLAYLYSQTGSLQYATLFSGATVSLLASTPSHVLGLSSASLAGLLIFIGVIGKSAQFPLHVWLPDAMEGPTPVSAMIHAATMVSAGVYLAIRISPLISAGWDAEHSLTTPMIVVGSVGAFTALFASTIALTQRDIKRTLAYSTISQLGYMIAAVGIGAPVAAAFHLLTHAFFKALLFMGSGSVIHGVEHGQMHSGEHGDAQDMFRMGGLARKMPITFVTFLIGGLALAGFPLITAGFWSKDAVLAATFGANQVIFWVLVLSAFLTAFYTMRQITLVFLGQPRSKSVEHAGENKASMTLPMVVLAFFAITLGWIGIPTMFPGIGGLMPDWLPAFLGESVEEDLHSNLPLIMSVLASLSGLSLGWLIYRRQTTNEKDPLCLIEKPFLFVQRGYEMDRLYNVLFIRPAKWLSEVFSSLWLDKKLIDGSLHGIAKAVLGTGRAARRFIDVPVINGGADLTGRGIKQSGAGLKRTQTGQVQQYVVFSLIALSLAVFFVWILVV